MKAIFSTTQLKLTSPLAVLFSAQFLGILCMACSAPAYYATQHWFLLVVVCAFIGSWFFLFYHFVLDTFMKSSAINWLQTVMNDS